VLTPHDGEFAALTGERPGADRMGAVRDAAARYSSTVLLKGATTLVGGPDGEVAAVTSGDARLATAGTGDVLSGVLAAFVGATASGAQATPARLQAAVAGAAWVHGAAALRAPAAGLVSSDLPDLIGAELASLAAHSPNVRPNRAVSGGSGRKLRRGADPDASWGGGSGRGAGGEG
jgi:NAD(P)H-hydrate repair Nnr-like enzyme with NAD(P)H-hydrate dehydratase domain